MAEIELVRDPMPEPYWPGELPRPSQSLRGELALYSTRLERSYRHGPWSMGEIERRPTDDLSRLAGRREGERLEWGGALFLDLEAGAHPRGGSCLHVAGVGRFVPGGFEVRQYAARCVEGERLVLEAVARELAGASDLVTFAGRSFDAPLLSERSRAEGVELALPARHFDLYRMSAKLLRRRFEDARLVTLERELLRFERVGDLPGAAVPRAWQAGDEAGADALRWAVVRHNLLDVIALPALAAELALRLESPEEALEQGRLDEREAAALESELSEARGALAVAPPHRREAARRRVKRLERRLAALRGEEAT